MNNKIQKFFKRDKHPLPISFAGKRLANCKFPQNFFIVMIAPTPFYSGRGTHLRILHEAKALAERGHKIIIVTYHIGDTPHDLPPNITIKRINRLFWWYTKKEAGPNWQKIFLDFLLFIKVFRICLHTKPDVLHGHLHEGVLIGWLVKKLLVNSRLVLVGDFHGALVNEMRSHGYLDSQMIQKLFVYIERFISRIPGQAFVSSPNLKCDMESKGQAKEASRICVISDAPTMKSRLENKKINPKMPYKKECPCVVYTGGFTPDKGIEKLFEIIIYSIQNGLSCRWIVAGSPLSMLSIPRKIKKSVTVVSPLDYNTLTGILENADVACEPKQGDVLQGSGKLLNYMYAGIPVVCFDGPAQRFYLGTALSSRLIAKDNYHFYRIVRELLELPVDEKKKLKNMILQRVHRFSWAQGAEIMEQYYIGQWKKEQKLVL